MVPIGREGPAEHAGNTNPRSSNVLESVNNLSSQLIKLDFAVSIHCQASGLRE